MEKSAGIVVVKRFDNSYKLLSLKAYGKFDLPKGGIEEYETAFQAAIRETEEESGITDLRFKWGYEYIDVTVERKRGKKVCTLFLAETEAEPHIMPNPETLLYEHSGFEWLTFDEASQLLHNYLRPSVEWARKRLIISRD